MNVNLLPNPPAISTWLREATVQLVSAGISSAKLDAEIILSHTLKKQRTFLRAHSDDHLTNRQLEISDARLQLRIDRTPIAYIIGHKEFYGRLFQVTPSTLVPRPESETMISLLKELQPHISSLETETATKKLVDVGTGTGCLGITAKLEVPHLNVTLIDISHHALKVAEMNARRLKADVTFLRSDLLTEYPFMANFILANLPYVDQGWIRSPETNHEPAIALFAADHGLHLINKLIQQCDNYLLEDGLLLLEADPRQHDQIIKTAKNHGLVKEEIRGFIVCLRKL